MAADLPLCFQFGLLSDDITRAGLLFHKLVSVKAGLSRNDHLHILISDSFNRGFLVHIIGSSRHAYQGYGQYRQND